MPIVLPSSGKWLVRILGREGRLVVGMYRRHMKAITYLGKVDRLFGVPATTRNWNTILAIAKVFDNAATDRRRGRRQEELPNNRLQRTVRRAARR